MRTLSAIIAALAACASQTVAAQTIGQKYDRTNVTVNQNSGLSTKCRPAIARAVATWNGQSSPFTYSYSTTATRSSLENGDDNNLTFDYTSDTTMGTALAQTRYDNAISGNRYRDADIYINANRLFYTTSSGDNIGEYFCPSSAGQTTPSNRYDFETVVLHELGHAFGLAHFSSTSCTLYASLAPGQQKRVPCSTEVGVFNSIY
ncbi:matrixin family metalloprotease [Parerythrobacter lacustris]|uniref:Matrixin family metalloprotease n=1 Tax=Parerythrobacter lacustris TaxID=2969984 RepID=A0ABT1XW51_9SPHN|nr:matrixin family metalloprotease [Parerythrobacter lacustris]MCR2834662.1 matrixin family metalloprotease [Parerythrobacter lacustris]